jgi:hypothetical protein
VFYLHYFISLRFQKYPYDPKSEGKKLIFNNFYNDYIWVYDSVEMIEIDPLMFVFN